MMGRGLADMVVEPAAGEQVRFRGPGFLRHPAAEAARIGVQHDILQADLAFAVLLDAVDLARASEAAAARRSWFLRDMVPR